MRNSTPTQDPETTRCRGDGWVCPRKIDTDVRDTQLLLVGVLIQGVCTVTNRVMRQSNERPGVDVTTTKHSE